MCTGCKQWSSRLSTKKFNESISWMMSSLSWYFPIYLHIPSHGSLARYVKLRVAHAPEMVGTFSPPPRVCDPDMHHGTCVTHMSWCMPGLLTSGFLWSRRRGKRSRHSRRMHNVQVHVSCKRPMKYNDIQDPAVCGTLDIFAQGTNRCHWANMQKSDKKSLPYSLLVYSIEWLWRDIDITGHYLCDTIFTVDVHVLPPAMISTCIPGPLLLTWNNFNPRMDK